MTGQSARSQASSVNRRRNASLRGAIEAKSADDTSFGGLRAYHWLPIGQRHPFGRRRRTCSRASA